MKPRFDKCIDADTSNKLIDLWEIISSKLDLPRSASPYFKRLNDGRSVENVYSIEYETAGSKQFWIAKDKHPINFTQQRAYKSGLPCITPYYSDMSSDHFMVFGHAAMISQGKCDYLYSYTPNLPNSVHKFFQELNRISNISPRTPKDAASYFNECSGTERLPPDFVFPKQTLYDATSHTINFHSSNFNTSSFEIHPDEGPHILPKMTLIGSRRLTRDLHVLIFEDDESKSYWIPCGTNDTLPRKDFRYNLVIDTKSAIAAGTLVPKAVFDKQTILEEMKAISQTVETLHLIDQHGDLHQRNVLFAKDDFLIFDFGAARADLPSTDYTRFCASLIRELILINITQAHYDEVMDTLFLASSAHPKYIVENNATPQYEIALRLQMLLFVRYFFDDFVRGDRGDAHALNENIRTFIQRYRAFCKRALEYSAKSGPLTAIEEGAEPTAPSKKSVLHPKLKTILHHALTRVGSDEPFGTARRFLDHYLHRTRLPLLTPLQEKFSNFVEGEERVFDSSSHVLISGPTSSGKTTLSDMFLFRSIFVNDGENARALFLSPTKALAHEKYESLKSHFRDFDFKDGIEPVVISTGDESDNDPLIASGRFRIVCTVYEKANILFSRTPAILSQIGMIIIDELHMFMDLERGPLLELIAAKLQRNRTQLEFHTTPTEFGQLRPRIIGISTDELLVRAFRDPLTIDRFNQAPLAPIEISDSTRPTDVKHFLVMPVDVDGTVIEVPIGSTAEIGFPNLPHERRRNLTNILIDHLGTYKQTEARARTEKRKIAPKEERVKEFLQNLLNKRPCGERILCFVHSRTVAEALAAELTRARGADECLISYRDIVFEGLSHIEDTAVRTNIESYATAGVFVHHSDLPSMSLRAIEEVCREQLAPTEPSQIIVATQTLSYGVNLAITSVVLCGQKFSRSTRDGEVSEEYLSNCEYHNMVGRCGRLGKTDRSVTEAYVIFDVFKTTNENAVDDFFKLYYSTSPAFDSVVFTAEDEKAEKRINSRLSFRTDRGRERLEPPTQNDLVRGVNEFSLPFIRAVMDGLRHLNYETVGNRIHVDPTYVSADDIADLFEQTPFGKKFLRARDSNKRIAEIFDYILRALKQREYKLVKDDTASQYLITERGDAILNTGKGIEAVQQYQRFLYFCDDLYDHHRIKDADKKTLSPYIYLTIVMAQNDVVRVGAQYTCEYNVPTGSEEYIANSKQQVIEDFCDLLNLFRPSPLSRSVLERLLGCIFDFMAGIENKESVLLTERWQNVRFFDSFDKVSDRRLLTLSIFRLTNYTLSYMLGDSSREMDRFLRARGAEGRKTRRFMGRVRYFESVSYGIAFLAALIRTSSDKRDVPSEELAQRLRLIAEQAKLGFRASYLPFASLYSRKITRQDIVGMCRSGVTVSKVLGSNWLKSDSWKLPRGMSPQEIHNAVTQYFEARFASLAIVWAEKGRASDDRLLSNIARLWDSLSSNYLTLIASDNSHLKKRIIHDALNALFYGMDKSIDLGVFGLGVGNATSSPKLRWQDAYEIRLSYSVDEDNPGKTKEIKILFIECGPTELTDLDGDRLSSTKFGSSRADDYWLVSVTPKMFGKLPALDDFVGRLRPKDSARVALFELDAFFLAICAVLRGFYVSIEEITEIFMSDSKKHLTAIDVVTCLSPQETVTQILKASIEYNSVWSFDEELV